MDKSVDVAYWCFYLDSVAEHLLYLEGMKDTVDYMEVREVISSFRRTIDKRRRGTIPN